MTATSRPRALVVGGTSGIGWAIADAFSTAGYDIVVTGLAEADVQRVAAERPQWQVHQLDVRSAVGVDLFVSRLEHLHVLVHAAGMILRGDQEHTAAGFERVVDVNLHGMMRTCYACRERLFASRGCVITMASMLSFFGSRFVPAYSASKGAVLQLTRSLAIAWAPHGVRVNAIAPGWIETPLTRPLFENPERRDAVIARTPLGRWGRPADVAGAALFLASPAAAFITGVVLPVDGGYSIA